MPKLVKICRNNYTVMNNAMWRDPKLGATERGVLGTMLTLPDTWDFSIKGLSTIFPDGERKIGTSLKKIEEAGYLKRVRIYSNGKITDWEYQFSDEPIFLAENKEQSSNNCDGENNSTPESNPIVENYVKNYVENSPNDLHCQNSNVENTTPEESLDCCFEDVGNLHLRKSNANKIYNNKINNNQFTLSKSNQSISNKGKKPNVENSNDVEKYLENSNDVIDEIDFKEALEEVSIQISTDYLRSRSPEDDGLIDEITHIIANAYTTHCQYLRIGGDSIDINLVRQRFQLLDYSHIEYVEDCLNKTTTFIQNRKNYLLTCLYFAPISIDGYYSNLFNHNMSRGAI